MKTYNATAETVERSWFLVDAEGQTLGRLATEVAHRLRGKHKPVYTPHVDTGDYIVIINAEKIKVTGRKLQDKIYHHHTGYIGNLKSVSLGKLLQEHPTRAIEKAVKGMLPKNSLGRAMFKKMKVYAGPEHKHAAQQPQELKL
ncbi:MAG: 50S ribosomal protein L13 [Gammaproteobacteria bacterium]|nr:50S ribosomal protein L13 [Gammaproteobacteria bacterium]NNM14191.1 50S ribosomal protein L13 [Gammaproteobacteria bacterium]